MADLYIFCFKIKSWRTLVAFIFISNNFCFAQENIRFERISVNEGLSQSDVKSFVQDKFGFLWVGTRDGLNKYDGVEFRKYTRNKSDSTSLYFNKILDLEMDLSGDIWISSTGGISVYDYQKDKFQNFFPSDKALQDADINHILLTGENTALLSTSKGLINFDRKQRKFFIDQDLALFKDMQVSNAYLTPDDGIWVGTGKGVFIKSSAHSGWARLLENNSIQNMYFDKNGKVYFSASTGLFSYDLKKKKMEQIVLPPDVAFINDVLRMKNGDLWVAGYKVMVLDKNDSVKYILGHDKFNNYSLSENRARTLFQTRDEVIWVGTFGYGLNKFNPDIAEFSYLGEQSSLPLTSNYVSAIFTADDTTLLVGTSRGLDIIDLKRKSSKHFSADKDLFRIFKIITDQEKKIWVSSSNGLLLYSGNNLVPQDISLRSVYDFAEWDDSHLILTSGDRGIYLFNKKTHQTSLFIPAGNLPQEVSCLLVENDHLWVGGKNGLILFTRQGQLIKNFKAGNNSPGSFPSSLVKSFYRDSRKNLWIGTWGGGLSLLNTKDSTFTTYTENDGLPNNVVYGMLEDRSGTLWLSTNLGISAFNPKDKTFRNFDFFDGLQSNEFNTGAYFRSARGKLYFGGVNGLSFFNPEKILEHDPVPPILVTAITLRNKALTFKDSDSLRNVLMIDKIRSGWKENDIGVNFTLIDFKQALKRSFQYSIQDTIWYNIGNRRNMELIGLSAGRHEIKVRTRKPDANWSQPEVLLTIDIIPAVWQRTWFKITAVLVFLLMIFAVYRYRVVRLKQANVVLNKLVTDRTKEIQTMNEGIESQNDQLRELNNELEAFSYSISHDLRAPLRAIIGYSKMLEEDFHEKLDDDGKGLLNSVQENALRMSNLIDDLLEFSKLGKKGIRKTEIDTEKLLKEIINEINTSTPHKADIRLGTLPSIYADRSLLSQVWINLISNAIKYSANKEAPVVEIGSDTKENKIIFYVKDNGAGFNMNYADKLFGVFQRLHGAEFPGTGVGLALVKRIVDKHGGRVWADAKENEGATFYFSLPK
jgi:signal transduction histidine kinase/ligand-binding sensor domain-containing protein